jgi:S-DNA-T family DNA segregation ATPase FtsK/SpoIIIE
MAVKRKSKSSNGKSKSLLSIERKKKLLGLLFIFSSILLLLSIISYSRFDEANLSSFWRDLFSSLNNNQDTAVNINNWLGIFGAHLSSFFIGSTLGIFSAVLPLLMLVWGIALFFKIPYKTLIKTSNFLLAFGILLSALFGVLRMNYNLFPGMIELSGSVGNYLGEVLGKLLGGVGGIIFLITGLAALIILTFNISLEGIAGFFKNVFEGSAVEKEKTKDDNLNLKKIKALRKDERKKRKRIPEEVAVTAEDLMDEGSEEQTRIRIIRKDEPEPEVKNELQEY